MSKASIFTFNVRQSYKSINLLDYQSNYPIFSP